ncbi:hypothetical protein [Streptomyces sp. MBT84]|uniref:hypothetical protein n=1 Tax=Streptomyces sp. MBT84 TaxID=1488414 RepID=UPI001C6EEBC9|nr:hypothetical protein [Streptomyces sp. MBT84]
MGDDRAGVREERGHLLADVLGNFLGQGADGGVEGQPEADLGEEAPAVRGALHLVGHHRQGVPGVRRFG